MLALSHLDLMHATAARLPHSKPGWVYELKYDGFRCLVLKEQKSVRFITRRGNDLAGSFPELVAQVLDLTGDAAIDAELVVQDTTGAEMFGWLVGRAATRKPDTAKAAALRRPAALFAFDLLTRGRADLRKRPLMERKSELRELLGDRERIRYAHYVDDGLDLYQFALRQNLVGIVCKQAGSTYIAGRSTAWLKVKTPEGRERQAKRMEHLR
jgi:ATP-dependent DNA ligase